jgi:hypothetical protein
MEWSDVPGKIAETVKTDDYCRATSGNVGAGTIAAVISCIPV